MLKAGPDRQSDIHEVMRYDTSGKGFLFPDDYYLTPDPNPPFVNKNIFITPSPLKDQMYYTPEEFFSGGNIPAYTISPGSYISYLSGKEEPSGTFSHENTDAMLGIILFSLMLLTVVKLFYSRYLTSVLASVFRYKFSYELYHDKNTNTQNTLIMLQFIFAINTGLFSIFVLRYFGLDPFPGEWGILIQFLICSVAAGAICFLKVFILKLTGYLFAKREIFSEYAHNISLLAKSFGLFLFPVIAGALFAPDNWLPFFIYSGLAAAILYYIAKIPRGFKLLQNKEFSLFYLFLYLCTVEIIPLIIAFRFFQTHLVN